MPGISCDLCGEEDAVMLQTGVADGSVIAVGGACVFPFYVGAAIGIAADMPADTAAAYSDLAARLAATLGKAAGILAAKPGRGTGRAVAAPGGTDNGGGGQTGESAPGAADGAPETAAP